MARAASAPGDLESQLHDLVQKLYDLDEKLSGNRSKRMIGENINPTISSRIRAASAGTMSSTYGPTPTHKRSLEIAAKEFRIFKNELDEIINVAIPQMEKAIIDLGAPIIE